MSANKIILVDDDTSLTSSLSKRLNKLLDAEQTNSFEILTANDVNQAKESVKKHLPQVAVVDLSIEESLGPDSGLQLIYDLQKIDETIKVIVLTGHSDNAYGISALNKGASSFIAKPADPKHLLALIIDALKNANLKREYRKALETLNYRGTFKISSNNKQTQRLLKSAEVASQNKQNILIQGETGTGKGVLAKEIHLRSKFAKGHFVRFQSSGTSHDIAKAELFGHEKGAFTGALEKKEGLVHIANNGTLFIDEIDSMSLELQAELLNVIQEKTFRRLGSIKDELSNFRLICATNANLEVLINEGKFRADLYHRISQINLTIPPLRERTEDIEMLAKHFLEKIAEEEALQIFKFSSSALESLKHQPWQGNIRELQSSVENAAYRSSYFGKNEIEIEDLELNKPLQTKNNKSSFREQVKKFELEIINSALAESNGNQSKAAENLQLDRSVLRRILARKD